MSEPTLTELLAQRAELNRQIAAAELGPAQAALAALTKTSTKNTLTELQGVVAELPDSPMRQQIQNVVTVLTNVPAYVTDCVAQLDALVNPPAPPADEPPAEG